nr:hypothetical protein CFP56_43398 [Quercus suber]
MLEFKDNLAATWAEEFPDLLTQEKENLLKDSTKVLILLIVQSEAAIAVEDVAVAASEFTLIQPWGGGVQHGYEAVWDFEDRQ